MTGDSLKEIAGNPAKTPSSAGKVRHLDRDNCPT